MNNNKLPNFDKFEQMIEAFGNDEYEQDLNEGLFSGIANFFSRMFGGKVSDLDRIIGKYKQNESDYWDRWINANHQLNKAELMHGQTNDAVKKQEYVEMAERNEKLLVQIEKTRNEVNDALDRQADNIIGGNKRLFDYWDFKKAKADEEVARKKYEVLKGKADENTLNTLYAHVEKSVKKLKETTKDASAATKTIMPGDFANKSKEEKEVPFKDFGIFSMDDFLFAADELWDSRIKLMPKANLKLLAQEIDKTIKEIESRASKETSVYKKEIDGILDTDTAKKEKISKLERSIADVEKYSSADAKVLSDRGKALKNKILIGE